ALMSLAMQSLSTVAAENSPNKEVGVSEMEAMRKVVSLYYGNSPEAKIRWQGWTVQSQRGLMVDELKMKAVELHMLMKLYQQGQRHEALLGGQLAVEAGREYNRSASNAASVLQSGSLPR
ncbi:MAG: hypothetical protein JNM52_07770, partial [Betaproteobacteria bacterium]|nr:hypothetical protein [Betaproteobacteria bacterium]